MNGRQKRTEGKFSVSGHSSDVTLERITDIKYVDSLIDRCQGYVELFKTHMLGKCRLSVFLYFIFKKSDFSLTWATEGLRDDNSEGKRRLFLSEINTISLPLYGKVFTFHCESFAALKSLTFRVISIKKYV